MPDLPQHCATLRRGLAVAGKAPAAPRRRATLDLDLERKGAAAAPRLPSAGTLATASRARRDLRSRTSLLQGQARLARLPATLMAGLVDVLFAGPAASAKPPPPRSASLLGKA